MGTEWIRGTSSAGRPFWAIIEGPEGPSYGLNQCARPLSWIAPILALLAFGPPTAAVADETEAERAARINQMSTEDKALLAGKKKRFDELKPPELAHLQGLYEAISSDAEAQKHEETIRRYNKWLADLSSGQRGKILDIKDPKERIDKIKELMRKQEEERFQQFVELDVTNADRDTVYAWLEAFIVQHEDQIMTRLREEARRRIQEAPDEAARRKALIDRWQSARWYVPDMPFPTKDDFNQLFAKLSDEAKTRITAGANTDEQEQRLTDLMRAAIVSRVFSQPSREDLQKFYANMKPDDPRRERLEGLDREKLYQQLRAMYYRERFPAGFRGRGGPGSRGGGPPFAPPGEGGGQRPPPKGERPPAEGNASGAPPPAGKQP